MRVQNTSATAINIIFIDVSQFESYAVTPVLNELSDHDAQLLMISTDYSHMPIKKFKTIRKINRYTLSDFNNKLSYESWDTIFKRDDVSAMFNSFLNIYLKIFYSSFPLKSVINWNKNDNNNRVTFGIKTSCEHKRELYFTYRNSDNQELKRHCQVYCKILSNVIKEAKRIYYDKKFKNQAINIKPLWISLRSYLVNNILKLIYKS